MNDSTLETLPAKAGLRRRRLLVGQPVEIRRGVLAGLRGVLMGFGRDQKCLIKLNVAEGGVVLLIDAAAVQERSASASDEDKSVRAQGRD
jgi:hypothetical protein